VADHWRIIYVFVHGLVKKPSKVAEYCPIEASTGRKTAMRAILRRAFATENCREFYASVAEFSQRAAPHPKRQCHPERSAARWSGWGKAEVGRVGRRAVEGPQTFSSGRESVKHSSTPFHPTYSPDYRPPLILSTATSAHEEFRSR
jgi:hypothetical protein